MANRIFRAGASINFDLLISGIGPASGAYITNNTDSLVISGLIATTSNSKYTITWDTQHNTAPGSYNTNWITTSGITASKFFLFPPKQYTSRFTGNTSFGSYTFSETFKSMQIDMRNFDRLGDPFIEEWGNKASHFLINIDDVFEGDTRLVSRIRELAPNCKIGAQLFGTIQKNWISDFYAQNKNTIGYYAYPLLSGVEVNTYRWEQTWNHIINITDLDFYVLNSEPRVAYTRNNTKEIIVQSNNINYEYPHLLISGLTAKEYQQIQTSGVNVWTTDFNIAGKLASGYYGYGVALGDFRYKDAQETRYNNLEFLNYNNSLTRRSALTENVSHTLRPKMRFSSIVGQFNNNINFSNAFISGIYPSGCDHYYWDISAINERKYDHGDTNIIADIRKYAAPGAKIGAYWPDFTCNTYSWHKSENNVQRMQDDVHTDQWIVFRDAPWQEGAFTINPINLVSGITTADDSWQKIRAIPTYWSGLTLHVQAPRSNSFSAYPSGLDIKWEREEKSGAMYSGICWADGTNKVYYSSGDDFSNFNLGDIIMSTHGFIIPSWTETSPLDTDKSGVMDRFINTISGVFYDLGLDFIHVDGPARAGVSSRNWRNNPINFTPGQVRADWDGAPIGRTFAGVPQGESNDKRYYWHGYINTTGILDSSTPEGLDNTTLNGSNADTTILETSDEYTHLSNNILVHRDKWIESFPLVQTNGASNANKDFLLNGIYAWHRDNFVYNEVATSSLEKGTSDWPNWDSGDVWAWVTHNWSKECPNIVDTEIAKGEPTSYWATYFGWAICLLTDAIACPGRYTHTALEGGDDYNHQIYYNKIPIGDPINHAYKSGTTIRRDFTNGYVEIDDIGLNLKNSPQLKKHVRIITLQNPRVPRLYKSMHSDSRNFVDIEELTLETFAPISDYWKGDIETYYNSRNQTTLLRNTLNSYNSDIKIGANLHYGTWPETTWEAEYTSGLSTLGADSYALLSGATLNWTAYWDNAIKYTDLDFYVIEKVTSQLPVNIYNWIWDNANQHKEIILETNDKHIDFYNIKISGLALANIEQLNISGIYPWIDDYPSAAYVGCGYSLSGVSPGIFYRKISNLTEYSDYTFIPSGVTAAVSLTYGLNNPFGIDTMPGVYAHWDSITNINLSGNEVTSWNDSIDNISLTPAEGNNPKYVSGIDGEPTVRFNIPVLNDEALSTPIVDLRWEAIDVYCVANAYSGLTQLGLSSAYYLSCEDSAATGWRMITSPTSTRSQNIIYTQNGQYNLFDNTDNQPMNGEEYRLIEMRYDGVNEKNLRLYIDGNLIRTTSNVSGVLTGDATEIVLASYLNGVVYSSNWPGDIKEVIILSGITDNTDRTNLTNYLLRKHGKQEANWRSNNIVYRDPKYGNQ